MVNEDANARLVRELKEELTLLRSRINGSSESVYDLTIPPEQQMVSYRNKDGEIKTISKLELQDQFDASKRLMKDVTQTWEEKLEKSRLLAREREEAFESMGIVFDNEFKGIHAPKVSPSSSLDTKYSLDSLESSSDAASRQPQRGSSHDGVDHLSTQEWSNGGESD